MGRKVYIVSPGTDITNQVIADADNAGCSEILQGIPPRLVRNGVTGVFPFVYTEPDDPDKPGRALAVTIIRNTFKKTRTPAQIDNTLDALSLLMKQTISELKDLQ